MTRSSCLLTLGLLALLLSACGGGGGDDPAPPPIPAAVALVSDSALDGYLGFVSASATDVRNLENAIAVGDNDRFVARRSIRGFLSFDLRALPAGTRVLSATLQVYQTSVSGAPYTTLGEIRADHVDYGEALDYDEFGIPFLGSSTAGVISRDPSLGWKLLDVTDRVVADLADGRTRSQYRLRFGIRYDDDAVNDWALFEDGDMSQGTSNPPLLAIEFVVP